MNGIKWSLASGSAFIILHKTIEMKELASLLHANPSFRSQLVEKDNINNLGGDFWYQFARSWGKFIYVCGGE